MSRRVFFLASVALTGAMLAGCGGGGGGGGGSPGSSPGGMTSSMYALDACAMTWGGGPAATDALGCVGTVQSPAGTTMSVGSPNYTLHGGFVGVLSSVQGGR